MLADTVRIPGSLMFWDKQRELRSQALANEHYEAVPLFDRIHLSTGTLVGEHDLTSTGSILFAQYQCLAGEGFEDEEFYGLARVCAALSLRAMRTPEGHSLLARSYAGMEAYDHGLVAAQEGLSMFGYIGGMHALAATLHTHCQEYDHASYHFYHALVLSPDDLAIGRAYAATEFFLLRNTPPYSTDAAAHIASVALQCAYGQAKLDHARIQERLYDVGTSLYGLQDTQPLAVALVTTAHDMERS